MGKGNTSLTDLLFSMLKSMHHRTPPSRLGTRTGAEAYSEMEGFIRPASNIFCRCASSSFSNRTGVRRIRCFTGLLSTVSIECSIAVKFPKSNSSFAKTSWNSINNSLSLSTSSLCNNLLELYKMSPKCGGMSPSKSPD